MSVNYAVLDASNYMIYNLPHDTQFVLLFGCKKHQVLFVIFSVVSNFVEIAEYLVSQGSVRADQKYHLGMAT